MVCQIICRIDRVKGRLFSVCVNSYDFTYGSHLGSFLTRHRLTHSRTHDLTFNNIIPGTLTSSWVQFFSRKAQIIIHFLEVLLYSYLLRDPILIARNWLKFCPKTLLTVFTESNFSQINQLPKLQIQ